MKRWLISLVAVGLAVAPAASARTIPSPYEVQGSILGLEKTPGSGQLWAIKGVSGYRMVRYDPVAGWTPYDLPPGPETVVTEVAMASPQLGWALRYSDLLKWNGTSWTIADPPAFRDVSYFGDISATGPGNVWLSGARRVGETNVPTIWQRVGDHWKRHTLPSTSGGVGKLLALSPTNVWLVGTRNPVGVFTMHWDGTSWTEHPVPVGDYGGTSLTADGPNSVWIAVALEAGTSRVLHWNGSAWTAVPAPPSPPGQPSWIGASPGSDLWGVNRDNYLLRYDGSSWSSVPLPKPCQFDRTVMANGITVVSDTEVYVFGLCVRANYYTLALRYDGQHWQRI